MARAFSSAGMDPGERNRLVTIQQVTDGQDTEGAPTESWATLTQAWAAKMDLTGRERLAAEQMTASYDTRWQIGYRADMDPELVDVAKVRRLIYQGRNYDIVAASMVGLREGIELYTLAKVG